jgi:hypothetical protein
VNQTMRVNGELNNLMVRLGQNPDFEKFMKIIEDRCTGLAIAACSIVDHTVQAWAAGRVQEMSDWLTIFNTRHKTAGDFSEQFKPTNSMVV